MIGAADFSWRTVALGFRTDWPSLVFDTACVAAVGAYLVCVRRLGRRGRRWAKSRSFALVSGTVLLCFALASGFSRYDDTDPLVHLVQHLLVMMVVPPLLVLGRPSVLFAQASSRASQRLVVRLDRALSARWLSGPVVWILYCSSMPVYFLTPLYALSLRNGAVHAGVHAWFVTVGLLYANVVLGAGPATWRRSYFKRIALVVSGMPIEAGLGAALVLWPSPLAPHDSLAAEHNAGLLFWICSMVASGLVVAVLFARWILADDRRVARLGPPHAVVPRVALGRVSFEPWTTGAAPPSGGSSLDGGTA